MKVEEREAAGEFMAKQHYCGVDPEREAVWEAAKAFYVEARTVPADEEVEKKDSHISPGRSVDEGMENEKELAPRVNTRGLEILDDLKIAGWAAALPADKLFDAMVERIEEPGVLGTNDPEMKAILCEVADRLEAREKECPSIDFQEVRELILGAATALEHEMTHGWAPGPVARLRALADYFPLIAAVSPGNWISTDERLPDAGGWFWATKVNGKYGLLWYDGRGYWFDTPQSQLPADRISVAAWMPLPKPYKRIDGPKGDDDSLDDEFKCGICGFTTGIEYVMISHESKAHGIGMGGTG